MGEENTSYNDRDQGRHSRPSNTRNCPSSQYLPVDLTDTAAEDLSISTLLGYESLTK